MVLRKAAHDLSFHSSSDPIIEHDQLKAGEVTQFPQRAEHPISHHHAVPIGSSPSLLSRSRFSCQDIQTQQLGNPEITDILFDRTLQNLVRCTHGSKKTRELFSKSLTSVANAFSGLASGLLQGDHSRSCSERKSESGHEGASGIGVIGSENQGLESSLRDSSGLMQCMIDFQTHFFSLQQQQPAAGSEGESPNRTFSAGHICSRAVRGPGSGEELLLKRFWRLFADWKIAVERLEEHDVGSSERFGYGGTNHSTVLSLSVDAVQQAQEITRLHLLNEIRAKDRELANMKSLLLASGLELELLEEDGLSQVLSGQSCRVCTEDSQHHIIWQAEEE